MAVLMICGGLLVEETRGGHAIHAICVAGCNSAFSACMVASVGQAGPSAGCGYVLDLVVDMCGVTCDAFIITCSRNMNDTGYLDAIGLKDSTTRCT